MADKSLNERQLEKQQLEESKIRDRINKLIEERKNILEEQNNVETYYTNNLKKSMEFLQELLKKEEVKSEKLKELIEKREQLKEELSKKYEKELEKEIKIQQKINDIESKIEKNKEEIAERVKYEIELKKVMDGTFEEEYEKEINLKIEKNRKEEEIQRKKKNTEDIIKLNTFFDTEQQKRLNDIIRNNKTTKDLIRIEEERLEKLQEQEKEEDKDWYLEDDLRKRSIALAKNTLAEKFKQTSLGKAIEFGKLLFGKNEEVVNEKVQKASEQKLKDLEKRNKIQEKEIKFNEETLQKAEDRGLTKEEVKKELSAYYKSKPLESKKGIPAQVSEESFTRESESNEDLEQQKKQTAGIETLVENEENKKDILSKLLGGLFATAKGWFMTGIRWLGKFLMGGLTKLGGLLGKIGLKGLARVGGGIVGAAMTIQDAYKGFKGAGKIFGKDQKDTTGGEKAAATIGSALGGTKSGLAGAGRGALKGGAIGLAIGGPVGAAIGVAAGGLLGAIGGERIAKGLKTAGDAIGDASKKVFDKVKNLKNFVLTKLKNINPFKPFMDWFEKLLNSIVDGIKDKIKLVLEKVKGIPIIGKFFGEEKGETTELKEQQGTPIGVPTVQATKTITKGKRVIAGPKEISGPSDISVSTTAPITSPITSPIVENIPSTIKENKGVPITPVQTSEALSPMVARSEYTREFRDRLNDELRNMKYDPFDQSDTIRAKNEAKEKVTREFVDSGKQIYNTAAAEGGIVSRPTNLLAGEGGQPEAIIPLSKIDDVYRDFINKGINPLTGTASAQATMPKQIEELRGGDKTLQYMENLKVYLSNEFIPALADAIVTRSKQNSSGAESAPADIF